MHTPSALTTRPMHTHRRKTESIGNGFCMLRSHICIHPPFPHVIFLPLPAPSSLFFIPFRQISGIATKQIFSKAPGFPPFLPDCLDELHAPHVVEGRHEGEDLVDLLRHNTGTIIEERHDVRQGSQEETEGRKEGSEKKKKT